MEFLPDGGHAVAIFTGTNLMQSLPKTFSAHHAPPLVADLAKVMELYQNDLSDAASIWSS